MNAPISSMMNSPVLTVSMDDKVQAIEQFMHRHHLSWVPVREPNGAIIGVVSAAELMQFHALKKDPAAVAAWQVCSYKPLTVSAEASIAEVARLMLEQRLHHVIVTDRGTSVGIVSSLDFVRRFAPEPGAPGAAARPETHR